jgi:hypothetical protein
VWGFGWSLGGTAYWGWDFWLALCNQKFASDFLFVLSKVQNPECNVKVQSCVTADYMAQQSEINEKMYAILIDWLIDIESLCPSLLYYLLSS